MEKETTTLNDVSFEEPADEFAGLPEQRDSTEPDPLGDEDDSAEQGNEGDADDEDGDEDEEQGEDSEEEEPDAIHTFKFEGKEDISLSPKEVEENYRIARNFKILQANVTRRAQEVSEARKQNERLFGMIEEDPQLNRLLAMRYSGMPWHETVQALGLATPPEPEPDKFIVEDDGYGGQRKTINPEWQAWKIERLEAKVLKPSRQEPEQPSAQMTPSLQHNMRAVEQLAPVLMQEYGFDPKNPRDLDEFATKITSFYAQNGVDLTQRPMLPDDFRRDLPNIFPNRFTKAVKRKARIKERERQPKPFIPSTTPSGGKATSKDIVPFGGHAADGFFK
jgi:hypothetical protein